MSADSVYEQAARSIDGFRRHEHFYRELKANFEKCQDSRTFFRACGIVNSVPGHVMLLAIVIWIQMIFRY